MCAQSTTSVAQNFDADKLLPGDDMDGDPRWVREEIAEGVWMEVWKPARISFTGDAFVATVGQRVERFPDLDGAQWWCVEVMDVLPITPCGDHTRRQLATLISVMEAAR